MLSDQSLGLCEQDVYPKFDEMNIGVPREELLSLLAWWPAHWKEYAAEVTVPVLRG